MARYEVIGMFPIRNKKGEDVGPGSIIENFPEGTNVWALEQARLIKLLPEEKPKDEPKSKAADKGQKDKGE